MYGDNYKTKITIMMDIIRLTNMGAFMPRHIEYWIVAIKNRSQFKLPDGSTHAHNLGYL